MCCTPQHTQTCVECAFGVEVFLWSMFQIDIVVELVGFVFPTITIVSNLTDVSGQSVSGC